MVIVKWRLWRVERRNKARRELIESPEVQEIISARARQIASNTVKGWLTVNRFRHCESCLKTQGTLKKWGKQVMYGEGGKPYDVEVYLCPVHFEQETAKAQGVGAKGPQAESAELLKKLEDEWEQS